MKHLRWETARKLIVAGLRNYLPDLELADEKATRQWSIPFDDLREYTTVLHLTAGNHRIDIFWKPAASSVALRHALHFVDREHSDRIPIIAVPYMGPTGQQLCQEANVSWMDLSGNAQIQAPGLFVNIRGNSNRFTTRGRKSSVFASKSSRVVRYLLQHPREQFTNKRLVHETGANAGHISRTLERLRVSGYLTRTKNREFLLTNPQLLLSDWRNEYDFFAQNDLIRGHISARTSEELLEKLLDQLIVNASGSFAFTGLAAAWQYSQWVNFRLFTVYLRSKPEESLLRQLKFREEPRGANVWIAIPKDEGVFNGLNLPNGVPCVSRVQVYLDLKDHPERAAEAAEELYKSLQLGEQK